MNLSTKKNIIVGLEIGTTKIIVVIGEILKDGIIDIIGFGKCKTLGIEKGEINNLDLLIQCINKSVHAAEIMANYKIYSVYLTVSHKEIHCQNEIGISPIKKKEVTKKDVDTVINIAKSVKINNNHNILHIIPQEFSIDNQSGIQNPIGLSGIRIQANIHLITCNKNIKKNIIKAIKKCGINVIKTIFTGLASSSSVLTEEEKNANVCLIDIGGETMSVCIYIKGSIYHNFVIPYAGNTITRDIAYAFSLSYSDAEFIKKKYGYAVEDISITCKNLDIFNKKGEKISNCHYNSLVEVIEPRCIELLKLVNNEILKLSSINNIKKINNQILSNIVLTGGSSKIKSLSQCAQKIFNINVKIKKPCRVFKIPKYLSKPEYSTAVGLLYYGKKHQQCYLRNKKKHGFLKYLLNQMKGWLTR
ncbi:Cell division protein FtsA [Buchnera aphidicola (Cinara piceae)]|uniref:Cell division protein FtsA n=1 Tax=Buchnera aphidicola (Cinara piceae) TaxID=1660043 RepID=A0A803GCS1_9GAMM|nr:cell division protein FtsA [Buchnera aphidicola]VFP88159.1 Cell division protein FtsA [Buchnera aphidicola (Cinara piceae)]